MLRRLFLAVILAAPAALFAQQLNRPVPPPGIAQANSPAVVVLPSSPFVYAGGGPYGVYLTPLATLPLQQAGISLTSREGISLEAPLQTGVSSALPSPYNFGAPIAYPGVVAGGQVAAPAGGETEEGRLINDLIPSYYVGGPSPSTSGPSLGEFARAYKKSHPRAVRIFTNVDAERLSNSVAIPGGPAPSQQQNPPATPPQKEKENMKEERKPEMPRSTALVAEPGPDLAQP
jgi:hypothetical protein